MLLRTKGGLARADPRQEIVSLAASLACTLAAPVAFEPPTAVAAGCHISAAAVAHLVCFAPRDLALHISLAAVHAHAQFAGRRLGVLKREPRPAKA